MAIFSDNISINSILGNGSAVQGNVKINGFARIDGDIDGNLEASGNVIIGEHARIRGNVSAKSVTIIGGIVLGDISAPDFVKLLSSSVVIGDVKTKKIQADENVILQGCCISLPNQDEFDNAVAKFENARAASSMAIRI